MVAHERELFALIDEFLTEPRRDRIFMRFTTRDLDFEITFRK